MWCMCLERLHIVCCVLQLARQAASSDPHHKPLLFRVIKQDVRIGGGALSRNYHPDLCAQKIFKGFAMKIKG